MFYSCGELARFRDNAILGGGGDFAVHMRDDLTVFTDWTGILLHITEERLGHFHSTLQGPLKGEKVGIVFGHHDRDRSPQRRQAVANVAVHIGAVVLIDIVFWHHEIQVLVARLSCV